MIAYLIKSALYLLLFLLLYHFSLEKEKMHRFNRWYLLASIAVSFFAPFLVFTLSNKVIPVSLPEPFALTGNFLDTGSSSAKTASSLQRSPDAIPGLLFISLYLVITAVLLFRFTRNLFLLFQRIRSNRIVHYKGMKLVLLQTPVVCHSFLSFIFINEMEFKEYRIEDSVFTHEATHIKQKHSWDILFVELVQVFFWFNPLVRFYKKAIQLNHEFLADEVVIESGEDVHTYQYLLLDKIGLSSQLRFTSNLNYSITKKRLLMMTQTSNPSRVLLKKITALPLIAGIVFLFSANIVAQEPLLVRPGGGKEAPSSQNGVSAEMMTEYNAIIQQHITRNEAGKETLKHLPAKDREKLENIFTRMSKEQQSKVRVVFEYPPKPFNKAIPSADQLKKWKDGSQYGVWVDNKRVDNATLDNYKSTDFSHFFASRLAKNAINYGKHYVQIDLMTNDFYNDYYKKSTARASQLMALFKPDINKPGFWLVN